MEPTPQSATTPTCYRHADTETHINCTRCERPICPQCMRDAAVGFQCPECVHEGSRSVRQARTVAGGRISAVPLVTYALMAVNVLAYLGETVYPGIVERLRMVGIGLVGPDGGRYVPQDAFPPDFHTDGVATGEWYRLLTGAFLHLPPTEGLFGVLHIALNMWTLWNLGRVVESQLGRVRYLALYLISALGSSVLVLLIAPEAPTVGASGAIFGLGAAYYVIARRLGADMRGVNRFMAYFLLWMLISAGFTSWQGHLGGLLTGGLVTAALVYAPRRRRDAVQAVACVGVVALALLLAALKVAALT
ncbi:rhomboid family intramembrane serine protease [Streptomyces longispororuber]|uniref:rhomboid family intramembrane serine protease n=1 Tax=Streptomyces longispororuber TaxID=68230 RepID=UPI00210B2C61|nr:rhomboid family intramembrane serine protease [Streptomyces longispororuber]MCQ4205859.1 rhomboid family intramembrane serine protease [Streptomyces longispororuber]